MAAAAAAAGWNLGPGAGLRYDDKLITKTLGALEDLASIIPKLTNRLQSKEQLDERQHTLLQCGGSVQTTGGIGDQARFRVYERIGEGTFCVVFNGDLLPANAATGEEKLVALKFELRKTDSTQLRNEYRIYKKLEKAHGVPKIYAFGDVNFHKVLAMDLLGPSLETVFHNSNRRFSVKTVAMLAKQMLARIQTVHECGLIYRDIKPENFLIGIPHTKDAGTVYLVDFGMAKVYRDPETKAHIPYGEAQSLSGTARYMSINAHCRRSQSRRDDLEAMGHVFMYFLRGNLPWQGVKATKNDQRYEIMCEQKQATSIKDLCGEFPGEFAEYLSYTRGLPFDGDPDYDFLQGLFNQVLSGLGEEDDGLYDWLLPKDTAQPASSPSVAEAQPPPEPGSQQNDDTEKEKARPASPQPAALQVPPPASPPGKRRRSEFASDLRPPMHIRPKKTTFCFYDGDTQLSLATLHREIMAKRYAFHRAVGGSGRPPPPSAAIIAGATAAGVPASNPLSSSFSRFRHPQRGAANNLILPAFSELLDTTLGSINSELEDMSDKLLQGGDWTGMTRVRASFDKLADAVQREIQRLQQTRQRASEQAAAAAAAAVAADCTSGGGNRDLASDPQQQSSTPGLTRGREGGAAGAAEDIVVDVEELMHEGHTQARGEAPQVSGAGLLAVAKDGEIQARRTTGKERSRTRAGASAIDAAATAATAEAVLHPEVGLDALSLDMDPALKVDDADSKLDADGNDNTDEDDAAFALVYRTASGTRKVLRMPGGRRPE